VIHVRYTKWDGSLHWHFDTVELGEDVHGLWLGAPDGTEVRRGDEPPVRSQAFALLVPPMGWWTAVWNDVSPDGSGFSFEVYLDVCTPPTRDGSVVGAVDLDLDVARRPDGTTVMLDEDEFEEHRRRYGYPERVVDQARVAAASMMRLVEARVEPFGVVGPEWLRAAVALR
jgi:hypothetical protein